MGIQLQQTDTVAVDGAIAACSGASAGGTIDNRQATSGGTPGTVAHLLSLSGTPPNRLAHFESAANEPNLTNWPAGKYVVRLNVTAANVGGMNWSETWICRVNSSGVNQATVGSLTGQSIPLNTTGVKTMTVDGSQQNAAASDRIYIVLVFNGSSGDHFSYTPDQMIDTMLAPPPTKQADQWNPTWDFGGIASW
jgi:hypothetical protein